MPKRWIWIPVLTLGIGGCGSDDAGTASTASGGNSGSGGNVTGGTGGSAGSGAIGGVSGSGNLGGTAGSAPGGTGGSSGSGNLGGSAGGGGVGGALNDACYEMCDQQEKGENCLPELTQLCKDGCNGVTPALETKCPEVAKAYYDCNASIEYVCILGLASPKDPEACKAEGTAMNACTGA